MACGGEHTRLTESSHRKPRCKPRVQTRRRKRLKNAGVNNPRNTPGGSRSSHRSQRPLRRRRFPRPTLNANSYAPIALRIETRPPAPLCCQRKPKMSTCGLGTTIGGVPLLTSLKHGQQDKTATTPQQPCTRVQATRKTFPESLAAGDTPGRNADQSHQAAEPTILAAQCHCSGTLENQRLESNRNIYLKSKGCTFKPYAPNERKNSSSITNTPKTRGIRAPPAKEVSAWYCSGIPFRKNLVVSTR